MSKGYNKYSHITGNYERRTKGEPQTIAEDLSIKVQNNEPCPCGATRTREVFTNEGTKLLGFPVKYKNCCKGKALFFKTVEDRKLAEEDMNIRNPKRAKDILIEEGKKELIQRSK